ncbi:50S ribosomal protein L28 [Leptospira ilyithenensis]|uniref:Large ribosomal subunit protein bL28 n=1 Tax=Leptospira ilyithenensis TaxID=2484901 RepID=A0A4R9LX75_9LEPT|nr:50S ribosomal protein L28 [Leptospira ilyithenensis]TGN16776.1 50S ribosomal protein L28 [Leptospira ilyithenensis]
MARRCVVTGKGTTAGNNVSHSHKKDRRIWKVNVITKKIFLEDENRWVRVKISTRALRTLRKKGLKNAIKDHGGDIKAIEPKKYIGVGSAAAAKVSSAK